MQFKNKLLSGVFASTAIFGMVGAANAAVFTTTVSGSPAPVDFASEVAFTADSTVGDDRDDGGALISFVRSGGTYPSGNLVLRLSLSGATFDGTLLAGSTTFVNCASATSVISTGGTNGTTQVAWVLSNLDSCTASGTITMAVPFDLNGAGDADATVSLTTESGDVPVDNISNVVLELVDSVDAFDLAITAETSDVVADVGFISGPYLGFLTGNEIGTVTVTVDTGIVVDLNGAAGPVTLAAVTDVDDVNISIAGNFEAYSDVNFGGPVAETLTPTTAVYEFPSDVGIVNTLADIDLIPDGTTQIPASTYEATVAVDLVAGYVDYSEVGDLQEVIRNGSSEVLPWTASATQAGGTGSNNFVRVSNPTTIAFGPIFATVLDANATGAATIGDTATLAAGLAAGAEVIFTAADLEAALGNFGRADIRVTVEGEGAYITRLIQRTDGTYEINNR